jgi:hypothetical protein
MQIETDFLTSAAVQSEVNFQTIFTLQSEVSDAKKSKFDKSLKLAKLVIAATEWFDKSGTKVLLSDNGIEWDTKEIFFKRVLGYRRSYAYKLMKAGKIEQSVVTNFKRKCTQAENQGEDVERSIAALLKFANGSEEEQNVVREKTYATFSIAKEGINGDAGFSIRLTDAGIKMSGSVENENIDYNVAKLFDKLQRILRETQNA